MKDYKDTYQPTEKLIVVLAMDSETKGVVYFDDIHLEVEKVSNL